MFCLLFNQRTSAHRPAFQKNDSFFLINFTIKQFMEKLNSLMQDGVYKPCLISRSKAILAWMVCSSLLSTATCWTQLWRHWKCTPINNDVQCALPQSLPMKTFKFPNDVFKFVITEQRSTKLLSITSIFTVLIFNIYTHFSAGRNVEVTYVLPYNHPERLVENFGKKKKL